MTRDEVKADVDAAVEEFAQLIAGQERATSGVPKAPTIEVEEVSLEGAPFDFGIDEQPTSEAGVGDGGGGIVPTTDPTGACCLEDGTCSIRTESYCGGSIGGTYQGDGTVCAEVTCPVHSGACCVGTACYTVGPAMCASLGGMYHGDGTSCSLDTCVPELPCVCPDNVTQRWPLYGSFDMHYDISGTLFFCPYDATCQGVEHGEGYSFSLDMSDPDPFNNGYVEGFFDGPFQCYPGDKVHANASPVCGPDTECPDETGPAKWYLALMLFSSSLCKDYPNPGYCGPGYDPQTAQITFRASDNGGCYDTNVGSQTLYAPLGDTPFGTFSGSFSCMQNRCDTGCDNIGCHDVHFGAITVNWIATITEPAIDPCGCLYGSCPQPVAPGDTLPTHVEVSGSIGCNCDPSTIPLTLDGDLTWEIVEGSGCVGHASFPVSLTMICQNHIVGPCSGRGEDFCFGDPTHGDTPWCFVGLCNCETDPEWGDPYVRCVQHIDTEFLVFLYPTCEGGVVTSYRISTGINMPDKICYSDVSGGCSTSEEGVTPTEIFDVRHPLVNCFSPLSSGDWTTTFS
jgi:hypothetical protein